jgi:phenylacetate-CoA ligase
VIKTDDPGHAPPTGVATITDMSEEVVVSTPPFGPGSLGPLPRPDGQALWDPTKQAMSTDERRQLQDERLGRMIDRILEGPVPLFRDKLVAAGVASPGDIASVDDLSAVPSTVKQDLRDSEASLPPWGGYRFTDPRQAVRLGTSTGTTGQPTITVWTRRDLWVEYESGARNWWRMGYRPGMIVTHAHPAYLYGGGVMLQGTYEYMGLLSLWVPPPDTDELAEQAVRFWTRVTPDIPFMGFATGRFIEVATKLGIPLEDAGLTGLRAPPGFGLGRGGMPLMTAGAECYAYVGGPCGQSPGAHIHEDWAVVQAVDPATGREVPDGEWGNLTVTTLDRDNGLLRYDLEEACAILRQPCPCGETSIRGLWGGRFADLLTCQGTRFQLSELEASLRTEPFIAQPSLEYQVIRPDDGPAPLEVRVEMATEDDGIRDQVADRVKANIKETLGVVATVEVLSRDTIPRAGYKAKRVLDRH